MRDERFDDPKPDTRLDDALRAAYRALENGNADRQQGQLILSHLARITEYYVTPTIVHWTQSVNTPSNYELYCVEHQARRSVFQKILRFLTSHPDGRSGPTDQS